MSANIKTWQERADWLSDRPAPALMVEAMKAEIADLRAALAATVPTVAIFEKAAQACDQQADGADGSYRFACLQCADAVRELRDAAISEKTVSLDEIAAFEAAVCDIVPRPLFLRHESTGEYQEIMVQGFWYLWQARAKLSAGVAIPAGWALVPVEPTNAMLGEAFNVDNKAYADGSQHGASIEECWIAMVEAAPSPDQQE